MEGFFEQGQAIEPARCEGCGHLCAVRREAGERGRCRAGALPVVAAALLHHGEEPPISGPDEAGGGSGTIFFANCALRCVFCQNWQISQQGSRQIFQQIFLSGQSSVENKELTVQELADLMLELQAKGALNINLVSPTHYAAAIARALRQAGENGLRLPIVYNTGGFDAPQSLRLMDGLVDIYLPDAKLASPSGLNTTKDPLAAKLLGAGNYAEVNRLALLEMHRQVGHLQVDDRGVARRGLLIRHLVLPDDLARTSLLLPWIKSNFGPEIHISLMAQYQPAHLVVTDPERFAEFPGLKRRLREQEYEAAIELALDCSLENLFTQELEAAGEYNPDFTTPEVF